MHVVGFRRYIVRDGILVTVSTPPVLDRSLPVAVLGVALRVPGRRTQDIASVHPVKNAVDIGDHPFLPRLRRSVLCCELAGNFVYVECLVALPDSAEDW